MFHCFDLQNMNGVEWNPMEPISSHTINSFNFPLPPIWGVSNGMRFYNYNITTLPLFLFYYYYHFLFLSTPFFLKFLLSLRCKKVVCDLCVSWLSTNPLGSSLQHVISINTVLIVFVVSCSDVLFFFQSMFTFFMFLKFSKLACTYVQFYFCYVSKQLSWYNKMMRHAYIFFILLL
jgi:hypothetical protein